MMGKGLSGELSCPCDRSCLFSDLEVKAAISVKKAFQHQRRLGLAEGK